MTDNDAVDLLSVLHPLPPKVIRFKRALVSFAYLFAVIAFGWTLLFEAPAALSLCGIAALLVAMHFEMSCRIDVLSHVCLILDEQTKAVNAAQLSVMNNCVEDAKSVLAVAVAAARKIEADNVLRSIKAVESMLDAPEIAVRNVDDDQGRGS